MVRVRIGEESERGGVGREEDGLGGAAGLVEEVVVVVVRVKEVSRAKWMVPWVEERSGRRRDRRLITALLAVPVPPYLSMNLVDPFPSVNSLQRASPSPSTSPSESHPPR